jgi:ABC-type transporter Mla MlaB component
MAKLNGGSRRCESWVDSFVKYTENTESATIFRRWAAISLIGAVLEQKAYMITSAKLYPNLYVFLVGQAGIGKSRPIMAIQGMYKQLPEHHLAPTDVTMASMVDWMAKKAHRATFHGSGVYHSAYIVNDELSTFMPEPDKILTGGLTQFYDVAHYQVTRVTRSVDTTFERPQLSLLVASTPSNLMQTLPNIAWEQGFCSRTIFVYSSETIEGNPFDKKPLPQTDDLIHDLNMINGLSGQFDWTEEYANAMLNWRAMKLRPIPNHPKLVTYNTRRYSHMMKLAMISCVNRSNILKLEVLDFNRAMGWLMEAEANMCQIFIEGVTHSDSAAIDEIIHFIRKAGERGMVESMVMNYVRTKLPLYAINNAMRILETCGEVKVTYMKTGVRVFTA